MDKFNWASFGAGLVAANIAVAWAYIAHYIRSSKGHYVRTISTALETRRSRITSALSGQSEDDLIVFINLKKEEEFTGGHIEGTVCRSLSTRPK